MNQSTEVSRRDWPTAWTICEGKKSSLAQSSVICPAMKQATPTSAKPNAIGQSRVDEAKDRRDDRR